MLILEVYVTYYQSDFEMRARNNTNNIKFIFKTLFNNVILVDRRFLLVWSVLLPPEHAGRLAYCVHIT